LQPHSLIPFFMSAESSTNALYIVAAGVHLSLALFRYFQRCLSVDFPADIDSITETGNYYPSTLQLLLRCTGHSAYDSPPAYALILQKSDSDVTHRRVGIWKNTINKESLEHWAMRILTVI
jgi:hypothetical protein